MATIKNKMRNTIAKLQNLSEPHKKMIFFAVMTVAGILLFVLAMVFTIHDVSNIEHSFNASDQHSNTP